MVKITSSNIYFHFPVIKIFSCMYAKTSSNIINLIGLAQCNSAQHIVSQVCIILELNASLDIIPFFQMRKLELKEVP